MADVAFFRDSATAAVVTAAVFFGTVGGIHGGKRGDGAAGSGWGNVWLVFEVHCASENGEREVVRGGEIKVREARGWVARERVGQRRGGRFVMVSRLDIFV
jgi:hypothetical protein